MSEFYEYYWPVESAQEIALTQTPVTGKNLVLNGSYANTVTGTVSLIARGFVRKINLSFTGDFRGATFTVKGTQNGVPITNIVTGLNGGNAFTTEYFDTVTNISVTGVIPGGGTVASTADATDGYFPLILLNTEKRISNMAYALNFITEAPLTGCTYTIYESLQNIGNSGQTYTQSIDDLVLSKISEYVSVSQILQMTDIARNLVVKITPADVAASTLRMQFLQL